MHCVAVAATLLADVFCLRARTRVENGFRELFDPADTKVARLVHATLDGSLGFKPA